MIIKKFFYFIKNNSKDLLLALLATIIIPNIIIASFCLYAGVNRPLINIDYFLPIALIALLRFRLVNIIILPVFFILFFIDILLISLQFFPFIKMNDLIYLSHFIFLGPVEYRYYLAILIIILLFEYFIISKLVIKVRPKIFFIIFLIIILIQLVLLTGKRLTGYQEEENIINSVAVFFLTHSNDDFFTLKNLTPLTPTIYQNASEPFFKPIKSKKLLLIVAESWGEPKDINVQKNVLKVLKTDMSKFEYFTQGSFKASAPTVKGELRELCKADPQILDLDSVNEGFENCLPNHLKKSGYNSLSLFGGDFLMYGMEHWYKLAGFDEIFFGKDINLPKTSMNNTAIFDPDLMPIIADHFNQHEMLFVYWLTSLSHIPYDINDIRNHRFSCKDFDIDPNSAGCHNIMLHTQFFDALAQFITREDMQGVEVIVVGDHPPPILNFKSGIKTFNLSKVSWIHFKIKEKK